MIIEADRVLQHLDRDPKDDLIAKVIVAIPGWR
jgi:hypothetical protein